MIRFDCDYTEGAHPKILEKLSMTNYEQTIGYGEDNYCKEAERIIKEKCGRQDIDVHFLVGGTQTNLTVIAAALRPYQGAIAATTGHINVHETGAIEATGHKVLALNSSNGKLTANQIQDAYDTHFNDPSAEHMVQPKLVYISNPTEIGTIYSKAELTALSQTCKKNNLILYMDGARLGYGLCAEDNDLDLQTIGKLCDAFYIGGTKIGALFGEAVVISNEALKEDFRYLIKQKGGMLAKGRLLGIQFSTLFEDNLYFKMSKHADEMSMLIKKALIEKGYPFLIESSTNQQFPIMPDTVLEKLGKNYVYSYWQRIDGIHSAVRFCTSWATKEENVIKLVESIKSI
ncbi:MULTISPECIES: threonine aldolase family protein [Clostridium]|uniref:threonine aldolase family protein n=1 Tax=Clostridium TaxID=1485 RepID=UPI00069F6D24|nr:MULTISPECIES: low specificity L-threonine aldolase [Clostridium]KOF57132.1 threonine aldolase [Clostridium sp. DMHC 10]MCD2347648.1 low specificity L-threonine aldolase [Clostridium guangxiense]